MKFKDLPLNETIKNINSSAQYCTDKQYVYWTAKTTPWRGRRVTKILEDNFPRKAKILDIGSSQGLTISYIAQVFPYVQGIDIDHKAIATARQRLDKLNLKVRLTVYDGNMLPFKDNYFDGVIASEVFEHVENRESFIKEIHRILKKGGTLIISAPNKFYPVECEFHLPFLSYLPRKLANTYVRFSRRGRSYDHINHPTYSQFINCLGHYFHLSDITLEIIKKYRKYYLDKERGKSISLVSKIINDLEKYLPSPMFNLVGKALLNLSAGWIVVCQKKT